MTKNIPFYISLIVLLMNTQLLKAQVKQTEFKTTPLGQANLKSLSAHHDTITVLKLAPKPYTENDIDVRKAHIEQLRNAYLNRNRRSPKLDTLSPTGTNLPFVEGGFIDSLFTSGVPNDNSIAVGNNGDIVSVLNSSIRIYKQDGSVSYNVGLASFGRFEKKNTYIGPKTILTGSYDPRATYDPVADKFVVVWLDGRVSSDTRIMVAISKTGKPEDYWTVYALPGNPLNDTSWTDYPIVGMSKEDIFITVNLLKDNEPWQTAFKQSVIWQINKKEIFSDTFLNSILWSGIKHNGKSIWSICPVDQYYKSPRKEMYFLSVRPSDYSNDTVFIHKIDNTQASGTAQYSYKVAKGNKNYGLAGSAYQPAPNFRLQTNDARVLTAIFHYDRIQYVQNSINQQNFSPSLMYGYIGNMNNPVIENTLITNDTLDMGYPSIVYMGNGTNDLSAMLSFSHSSNTVFPGVSLVKIDNEGKISPIIRVKSGDAVINSFVPDSMERWGDYSGIQRKYNENGIFYLSNSFGGKNRPAAGTYIGRMRYNKETLKVLAEPATVYPNPSSEGNYHFKMKVEMPSDYVLTCYDLGNGNKVFTYNIHIEDVGDVVINQNLGFLSSGTYLLKFIRLSDNKVIVDEKVSKM